MKKFILILIAAPILLLTNYDTARVQDKPPIDGTFIQLLTIHNSWNRQDWGRLFDYYDELGMKKLIIQWTQYDDIKFYNAESDKSDSPLDYIMSLSDSRNMDVYVGLYNDTKFWEKVKRNAKLVDVYMQRLEVNSKILSDELIKKLNSYESFAGWYIPQETDDINWIYKDKEMVYFDYIREVSSHLKDISPSKDIAVSGFSNAYTDPETFKKFWSTLLDDSDIDIVLFQDGIGTNKLEFDSLPIYIKALKQVTNEQSRQLIIVVELFEQVSGQSIDGNEFKAEAASLDRVVKQIAIAESYTDNVPVAFSVMEYMTPLGVQNSEKLYSDYVNKYFN